MSMKTYIALLRGINVGGNNLLPMKALVALMEDSGYSDVKTYIQSGNVVFKSEQLPEDLGQLIETGFGFEPNLLLLSKDEFLEAANNNPYASCVGKEVHFYFCKEQPTPDIERLNTLKAETERYEIIDKVFYLHAPDGIGRSKLVANVEKCMAVPATGRNLNTVNKLLDMILG